MLTSLFTDDTLMDIQWTKQSAEAIPEYQIQIIDRYQNNKEIDGRYSKKERVSKRVPQSLLFLSIFFFLG